MNILLLGSPYLREALARIGHRVFCVGTMEPGQDLLLTHGIGAGKLLKLLAAKGFAPDVLVQMDDGNLPAVLGLESLPWPLVFYSIDTFGQPWHIPFAYAFDQVLAAQADFLPLFTAEGHAARWMPLCTNSARPFQSRERWLAGRDIPVAFVGTLKPKTIPARLSFLESFGRMVPLRMAQGDYRELFRRSRIVLNQSAFGEVNYRCFEAMGCGAALLHDSELHGFLELFQPGRQVLPSYAYLDAASAAAAARFWLDKPELLADLALAGNALVREKHSARVRAGQVAELCARLLEQRAQDARLAALPRRRRFLSTAYAALAAELPSSWVPHRELYTRAALDSLNPDREEY